MTFSIHVPNSVFGSIVVPKISRGFRGSAPEQRRGVGRKGHAFGGGGRTEPSFFGAERRSGLKQRTPSRAMSAFIRLMMRVRSPTIARSRSEPAARVERTQPVVLRRWSCAPGPCPDGAAPYRASGGVWRFGGKAAEFGAFSHACSGQSTCSRTFCLTPSLRAFDHEAHRVAALRIAGFTGRIKQTGDKERPTVHEREDNYPPPHSRAIDVVGIERPNQ
jgi:hypothetical protein